MMENISYWIFKQMLKTYCIPFMRSARISGVLDLPTGPKIFAPNHPNITDGFILPMIIPEKLNFMIMDKAFRYPFVGNVLKLARQIPVNFRDGAKAFQAAKSRLLNGENVVIFPEGILNPENKPIPIKTGAARLSLETGAPIIPVGFYVAPKDTITLNPKNTRPGPALRCQVKGNCFVHFGAPLMSPSSLDTNSLRTEIKNLTACLTKRIRKLSKQAEKESLK